MKKRIFTVALAVAFFLVAGSLQAVRADLFDWGGGDVLTVPDQPLSPGQDIQRVLFGADATSYFFRMDLAAAPTATDAGTWYGVYIGLPGNVVTSPYSADFALEASYRNFGGSSVFTPAFTDLKDPLATAGRFLENFAASGNVLEWQISRSALQSEWVSAMNTEAAQQAISFLSATLDPQGTILDSTRTTVTPIPGAAWLLASGLIALVGLRRKSH